MMGGEGKRAGMKSCSTWGRRESQPAFAAVTERLLAQEIRDSEVAASEPTDKMGRERGWWVVGRRCYFMVCKWDTHDQ